MNRQSELRTIATAIVIAVSINRFAVKADDYVRDPEPTLLEVRYERSEVSDTTKRDKTTLREETLLRVGKTKSLFCSVRRLWRDSIMAIDPGTFFEIDRARFEKDPVKASNEMPYGYYGCYIYKNYPSGKLTETSYFDMTDWMYEEDWEKPEWTICDESKTILGYECSKATTSYRGRDWTAWFTPEIAIQEGPWKLCGLPGLILEAYDSDKSYSFTAIGIIDPQPVPVGFLTYRERRGVTKLTRDKFFKEWWRYRNSNFGAKMRAIYGKGPKPDEKEKSAPTHDKEETDYPHDI